MEATPVLFLRDLNPVHCTPLRRTKYDMYLVSQSRPGEMSSMTTHCGSPALSLQAAPVLRLCHVLPDLVSKYR